MPRNNELGVIRRSQVVTTFGPGSVVDFRAGSAGGAPVSVIASGLDEWDERAGPPGLSNPQTIYEPRLQRQLGVSGFRLPPVAPQEQHRRGGNQVPHLLGARFPMWLQCPKCFRLKHARNWGNEPGDPAKHCHFHEANRVYVVPVRFIVACEAGHLDEFPWSSWVQHKPTCGGEDLRLCNEGASGLAGLILRCEKCGERRSMEGCFGDKALRGFTCLGRRPWLPTAPQACTNPIRALQRGASNLYFTATESALDIPPWSDRIQKDLGQFWEPLVRAEPGERLRFISLFGLPETLGLSPEDILARVNQRIELIASTGTATLKWEEYRQFTRQDTPPLEDSTEFEIEERDVAPELSYWIARVVEARRLREVRALRGFTRIKPPGAMGDEEQEKRLCQLSMNPKNWLPAIEVKGEGIFIELRTEAIEEWAARVTEIRERVLRIARATSFVSLPERVVTPRFVLLHTFAHLLMRQLSLDCGYGSSSLRERLYVGDGERDMAGILIYTSTSDADGTLGGLSRQARPEALVRAIFGAVASARWCPSDPSCVRGTRAPDTQNAAACHACALVAETSCELFNRFLDRASVIGTAADPTQGFFDGLGT